MPTTVKDIAKQLNLSTSTVCYALNGGPRTVTEEVKKRVLDKARELDYRPNRLARSLVKGSTHTIGVVPPSTETNVFMSPFVQLAWNAIVNEAEITGQDILLFAAKNLNSPNEPGLGLLDGRIDGVIFIAPMLNAGPIMSVTERGLPFASICSSQDAPGIHMTADNCQGIRQAIRHLIELGHTRIAHIAGSPDSPDGQIRFAAYRESMQGFDLPILDGYIEQSSFTRSFGYEATLRLLRLKDRPTAIIASNDELGVGACVAAREMGIDVPNDLSIVGFDDTEMASLCYPPLSTVQQPIGEMAGAAIRAVVRLAGGQNDVKSVCFPTRLVVRASTAPARQGALR